MTTELKITGGVYKTRNGQKAYISQYFSVKDDYPFCGKVFDYEQAIPDEICLDKSWTKSGKYSLDEKEHPLDLIEKLGGK